MLISNSTNQFPITDTEALNNYSTNDEKWAGNHFSSNPNSQKGFNQNYVF